MRINRNNFLKYKSSYPEVAVTNSKISNTSYIIGDVSISNNATINNYVAIRGDDAPIIIGNNVIIDDYSTIHIASKSIGTSIGENVKIGKYCIIHACVIEDDCKIGDYSVIMDGACIGKNSVLFNNTLVPPRRSIKKNKLLVAEVRLTLTKRICLMTWGA